MKLFKISFSAIIIILICLFTITTVSSDTLLTELISHWSMDNNATNGSTCVDIHNGNNGTIQGGTTTNVTGKIGEAYSMDGDGDYIDTFTGVASALGSSNTAFAYSVWFNLSSMGDDGLFYIGAWATGGFVQANIGANLLYSKFDGTQISTAFTDTTNWHLFVSNWNGTNWTIYIDNVEKASFLKSGSKNFGSYKTVLGAYHSAPYAWHGDLDEISIWNRSLNNTERTALWNSGNGIPYSEFGATTTTTTTTTTVTTTTSTTTTTCLWLAVEKREALNYPTEEKIWWSDNTSTETAVNYSYTGIWDVSHNHTLVYDENWTSYGATTSGNIGIVYMNYTRDKTPLYWQVGTTYRVLNKSISGFSGFDADVIKLRVISCYGDGDYCGASAAVSFEVCQPAPFCIDYDEGNTSNISSYAIYNNPPWYFNWSDYCISSTKLSEAICRTPSFIDWTQYECSLAGYLYCQNGACTNETATTTTTVTTTTVTTTTSTTLIEAKYPWVSNVGYDYNSDSGGFNFPGENPLLYTTPRTVVLSNPKQIMLVDDLDYDGNNEIVVLDGNGLKFYNNKTLELVDSITINAYESNMADFGGFSNLVIKNIDDDNYKEIIFVTAGDLLVHKVKYNGVNTTDTIICNGSTKIGYAENVMVGCGNTGSCLVVAVTNDIRTENNSIRFFGFNSTDCGSGTEPDSTAPDGGLICLPNIKHITIADIDVDSDDEYIYTYLKIDDVGKYTLKVQWIEIINNTFAYLDETGTKTFSDTLSPSSSDNCSTINAGKQLTSPIVYDIDGGSSSSGLFAVVGVINDVSPNKYKIYSFDMNGDVEDDYPEVGGVTGGSIGNIARINVGDSDDFCALITHNATSEIHILCGNEQSSWLYTESEVFDVNVDYNLTTTPTAWHNIIHSTSQSSDLINAFNPKEISTSYGIFGVDVDDTDELKLIFENPKNDGTLLMSDVEETGYSDMIILTTTNLWYLDDNFELNNCENDGCMVSIQYNPTYEETWKINTTVEIHVTATDKDNDDVSAKVTIYDSHENEQDSGWSGWVSSGTTIPFTFGCSQAGNLTIGCANETVTNAIIEVLIRDEIYPTKIENISVMFSVALEGITFGDIIKTDVAEVVVVDEDEYVTDVSDNAITNFIRDMSQQSNIGMSLIWLVVMVIVALIIWSEGGAAHPSATFGAIAIVELLLVIMGVMLNMIGFGVLVVLIIIAIPVTVFTMRKIFFTG